jgi:hypothetical protein
VLNTSNLHLFGAPLCADGINSVLSDKIKTFERLCNRVRNIDAHDTFFLLKNCLAIPKLTYTLRTSLCYSRALLDRFDTILKDNLSTILNIKYDDTSWKQSCLPVSSVGLGIKSNQQLSLPAFLASAMCSSGLIDQLLGKCDDIRDDNSITEATSIWKTLTGNVSLPNKDSNPKQYDSPIIEMNFKSVSNASNLLAVSQKESGQWLNAYPIPNLGLKMTNTQLQIAISLRLGTEICEEFECKCNQIVDKFATHALSCKQNPGRYSRQFCE